MGLLKKLIALYASYGLVHVLYKLLNMMRKKARMMKMIKGLPRSVYKDSAMGVAPEMIKNMHRRHDFFTDCVKGLALAYHEMGPKIDPGGVEILVKDPAVIKHFLKDNFDNYTKPENEMFWDVLRLWLGKGIFVASHGVGAPDDGRNWKKQRKIASNIFNRGNFNENMNDVFVAKARRMCELLREPAAQGEAVDMQAKSFQYTMDSIMQIFFGEKVDTMGGQANQYASAYDTAHRCLIEYFFRSIPALSLSKLLPWPFGDVDGLAHKIHRNTSSTYREFSTAYKTLDAESRRIIEASRADEKLKDRKDLLALFLQTENEKEPSLSAEWLRDVVLNMIIAGRDTTACTLSWMFYILATNPDIQKKVQAEIDAKFNSDKAPTIQSVSASELPYLNGVLYETLRLYPPVPVDGKEAINDDVLPSGQRIPAGSKMTFMVYAMGRDPQIYPEPEIVRPERWIPFKEPSQYDFPVFQGGPRICLGMNMAVFEAKIAALMILRQYSFTMDPAEAQKITYLPTALTMSICNTKGDDNKFDSHNLWLIPHVRDCN